MNKKVIIIGGGIAGMTLAGSLTDSGLEVVLLEKEPQLGGHVKQWDRLFPSRRKGSEVLDFLDQGIPPEIRVITNCRIDRIVHVVDIFTVHFTDGGQESGSALILATGYDLFDASLKEEYGYGIYNNVITSAELEARFKEESPIITSDGKRPEKVAFIHCVGSRDEKVGHLYCSKICCVTGVKQAIEIKQALPDCEVYSFYMDLRMFDRYFEEMYFEAQQKWGINFIRGRLSECAENPDHSIVIKTEDTLTGRPLKMTFDLIVLLVGMTPCKETGQIAEMLGVSTGDDGFLQSRDEHLKNNVTQVRGLFITGTVKGPGGITDTIADARATALQVNKYFRNVK